MPAEIIREVNPFERGPYVQVAALCERVLTEADGVTSLIRIVDRITHAAHGPGAPQEMPEFRLSLFLVVVLKSGSAKGRHEITITPELPSGEPLTSISSSIMLEGEGKGAQVVTQLNMPFGLEGLYWFNVKFDSRVISRLPLEVRYSRLVTG
ncbi:MAG: hypothetical protein Q7O66_20650 [Dehalococcoidia bacterium]|nr:hypothetical protein [Dehalococcoidia bacterium]